MAPVNSLCTQFLKSLLVGNSKSETETDNHVNENGSTENNSDDDDEMYSDDNE